MGRTVRAGAAVVVTGRVADACLTVAPAAHEHGWRWDDWDRLAAATVAGHLIECGAQVTGGLWCDWRGAGDYGRIGLAIYRKDPRIVYVCIEQGNKYNASTAYIERRAGIFRSEERLAGRDRRSFLDR